MKYAWIASNKAVWPVTVTFVESQRHRGTCYKAANWVHVGQTTGRGKKSTVHHQIIPAKDIWLYPLHKNFASVLCR